LIKIRRGEKVLFTDIHQVGTINFGSICSIKKKKCSYRLRAAFTPSSSSLFVDLQTRRAGRVLDGAMVGNWLKNAETTGIIVLKLGY
jgi:hypothetical protein